MVVKTRREKSDATESTDGPQWGPPQVSVGQMVRFYKTGERKSAHDVAVVLHSRHEGRTLRLRTMIGNAVHDGVRHVADPRMESNPGMRLEFGAWDILDDASSTDALKREVAALRDEVSTLRDIIRDMADKIAK